MNLFELFTRRRFTTPRAVRGRGRARAFIPYHAVLQLELLERRLTPCTVTIGSPSTVTNIFNENVVLNTHGTTATEILCNGVSKGTDFSHAIELTESGGTNTLTLDDSAFVSSDIYTIATNASGQQQMKIGSFAFVATLKTANYQSLKLSTGGGNNVMNVEATVSSPVVLSAGNGTNTFNVSPEAKFLDHIQASVTIGAGSGNNQLITFDQNDPFSGDLYTITGGSPVNTAAGSVQRTAMAKVSYVSGIKGVTVNGSTVNGVAITYNVEGTAPGTPVTINALGNGNNAFNMTPKAKFLDEIGGAVSINAGSGNNTLTTFDQNDFFTGDVYTIAVGSVQRSGMAKVSYNGGIKGLTVNGGTMNGVTTTYHIQSTAAGTPVTVNGLSNGSNRFSISPVTQYLGNIKGLLTLNGGGADTLVFHDTANPNHETYNFNALPSSLTLTTVPVAMNFSGMTAVFLETNGVSTVHDPSGKVRVDVPPPFGPVAPPEEPRSPRPAAGFGWEQAPADPVQARPVAVPGLTLDADAVGADLLAKVAPEPQDSWLRPDLGAWRFPTPMEFDPDVLALSVWR